MLANIATFLEDSARRFPHKLAVEDDAKRLSYQELRDKAYALASALLVRDAHREPVAIFMDRSVDCLAAMMGVAYSRCFYTIIDVTMPRTRIEQIMETLHPRFALVVSDTCELAQSLDIEHVIDIDSVAPTSATDPRVEAAFSATISDDLLYVLFTSGSTGVPKGVSIAHASMINYASSIASIFGFDESFRVANQAPFFFDKSHMDIYVSLLVGGTLFIPSKKIFSYPIKALDYLIEHEVTCLFWIPPLMATMANFRALGKRHVPSLKTIMIGGEILPIKQFNMWRAEYPDATFANLYGPTETTVDCAYYVVNREFTEDERLPIGYAIPGNELMVLDENGAEVSPQDVDVLGELCVRGVNLARGYYRNPEATARSFVQNPLNDAFSDIVYRTGDLVSYNSYGEIVYRSRMDNQIKRMGYRIELGEIELAASSLADVDQCCCAFDGNRDRIILFFVGKLDAQGLREQLSPRIPSYMLPDEFRAMAALPTNMNGKVDRAELTRMAVEGA